MQKTTRKRLIKRSKTIFTQSEDLEIKRLLTIMRAVSKERQISIIETLRNYYGFYISKHTIHLRIFTLDDYEKLKIRGEINIRNNRT